VWGCGFWWCSNYLDIVSLDMVCLALNKNGALFFRDNKNIDVLDRTWWGG